MSMDSNGKIIFAKHSEISQANLKNLAGMWRHYSPNKAKYLNRSQAVEYPSLGKFITRVKF